MTHITYRIYYLYSSIFIYLFMNKMCALLFRLIEASCAHFYQAKFFLNGITHIACNQLPVLLTGLNSKLITCEAADT